MALAERGECASLTASTLEPDLETLQREYDGLDVRGNAKRIDDVRYGVDARRLTFDESFDRIVFNFPCLPVAAGKDGNSEGSGKADASAIEENKELVRAFVRSAVPLLAPGGESRIVLSHISGASFVQKELEDTTAILHKTIDGVLERGVKLDQLVDKSNDLSMQSKMFYKQAKKTNSCCVIC